MLSIKKKVDYIKFRDKIAELTGCDVTYELVGENHFHYELRKNSIVLGVLCYDKGNLSFAPFKSLGSHCYDSEYIKFDLVPSFKDFTETLTKLGELVL